MAGEFSKDVTLNRDPLSRASMRSSVPTISGHECMDATQQAFSMAKDLEAGMNPADVSRCHAKNVALGNSELAERCTIMTTEYTMRDGKFETGGYLYENLLKPSADRCAGTRDDHLSDGYITEAIRVQDEFARNSSLKQSVLVSPSTVEDGKMFIYVTTRDSNKPNEFKQLAIEFQGSLEDALQAAKKFDSSVTIKTDSNGERYIASGFNSNAKSLTEIGEAFKEALSGQKISADQIDWLNRLSHDVGNYQKNEAKLQGDVDLLSSRLISEIKAGKGDAAIKSECEIINSKLNGQSLQSTATFDRDRINWKDSDIPYRITLPQIDDKRLAVKSLLEAEAGALRSKQSQFVTEMTSNDYNLAQSYFKSDKAVNSSIEVPGVRIANNNIQFEKFERHPEPLQKEEPIKSMEGSKNKLLTEYLRATTRLESKPKKEVPGSEVNNRLAQFKKPHQRNSEGELENISLRKKNRYLNDSLKSSQAGKAINADSLTSAVKKRELPRIKMADTVRRKLDTARENVASMGRTLRRNSIKAKAKLYTRAVRHSIKKLKRRLVQKITSFTRDMARKRRLLIQKVKKLYQNSVKRVSRGVERIATIGKSFAAKIRSATKSLRKVTLTLKKAISSFRLKRLSVNLARIQGKFKALALQSKNRLKEILLIKQRMKRVLSRMKVSIKKVFVKAKRQITEILGQLQKVVRIREMLSSYLNIFKRMLSSKVLNRALKTRLSFSRIGEAIKSRLIRRMLRILKLRMLKKAILLSRRRAFLAGFSFGEFLDKKKREKTYRQSIKRILSKLKRYFGQKASQEKGSPLLAKF